MPRRGSKGHLWAHDGTTHGIWYRNGARFAENLHTADPAEARAKLDRLMAECEEQNQVRQEKAPPSVALMLAEVVRDYRRNDRKSLEHVERHVKRLRKAFRGKRGDELTRGRILDYVDRRKNEGAANATINRELAALRLAYSLARDDGRIKPEMVPAIEMLPENNRRKGFFEPEQYEAVLRHLPAYLQGAFVMGYWTGMRKEEIFGLRWEQVDLAVRLVRLEQTKNGEDRTLPLNQELYAMLEAEWAGRFDGCPYIFHNGPERIKDFRKSWYTACVKAGVGRWILQENGKLVWEGKIFHDLRRTGVRNLIRAGVPQSVAMAISGHKDARIFKRYDIVDGFDLVEAMRKRAVYERELRVLRSNTFKQVENGMNSLPTASTTQ